jgi:hypothetical protein
MIVPKDEKGGFIRPRFSPDGLQLMLSRAGFQGIYVVMFVVFLGVALASALCLQNWRSFLPGAEGARSMLDGVKSAVYTVISQLS